MTVSYDKLWKLMKANKMKKSELARAAEISQYTMTKLNNDRLVSMEIMLRLCKIFHCDIGEIMEVIEDARQYLKEQGIDQWQDGFPTQEVIVEDIVMHESYVFGSICKDFRI